MQKVQHIIGADLSKKTIDLFCHLKEAYLKIDNNLQGFKKLLKWISQQQINPFELIIVMEHTGLYSFRFEEFLHRQQIFFTKVNALTIKHSIGLVRGKSDKIDASRILLYDQDNLVFNRSHASQAFNVFVDELNFLYALIFFYER